MTVLFKTSPLLWEQNEAAGYRKVHVEYEGNTILAFVANRTFGKWTSLLIPMGYTYNRSEVTAITKLYNNAPVIMDLLSKDDLTHEDAIKFLATLNA